MSDIPGRFAREYAAIADRDGDAPELLPVRLAKTCVEVLPVTAAGLSLFTNDDMRVPIGASSPEAADAERLQFTMGEGPCLEAYATSRDIEATERELRQRWPHFHAELVRASRFRAIHALPMTATPGGVASMDLYFVSDAEMTDLQKADVTALVELVGAFLRSSSADEYGPEWLDSSAVAPRMTTVIAIGMLNVSLRLSTADALDTLRAGAFSSNRTVDELADDVVHGRVDAGTFEALPMTGS